MALRNILESFVELEVKRNIGLGVKSTDATSRTPVPTVAIRLSREDCKIGSIPAFG